MAFKPIRPLSNTRRKSSLLTTGAPSGINTKILAQFSGLENAQNIVNYFPKAPGKLERRLGRETILDRSISTSGISMLKTDQNGNFIYGYADEVEAAPIENTGAQFTAVHTFTTDDPFSGVNFGKGAYFLVCNGGDKVGRITRTLDFDSQTSNFTVGDIITGGTSGFTGTLLEQTDAGATGTLTLGNVQGTPQALEAITSPSGGDGDVVGTLDWTFAEISGAPKAKVLYTFTAQAGSDVGARLFAGNLDTDPAKVKFSDAYQGTNPPFANWTPNTTPQGPGEFFGQQVAGGVNSISSVGDAVVTLHDDGFAAFKFTTTTSGTLARLVLPVNETIDFGGNRGALNAANGLYYSNETGIRLTKNVGTTNVAGSRNDISISKNNFEDGFFDDIDSTNGDFAYDQKNNYILITCAKNSDKNNLVLAYDLETKGWTTLKGWHISRFLVIGDTVYGADSRKVAIYKLFSTFTDDGEAISTEFDQEINISPIFNAAELRGFFFQAEGFPSTNIRVDLDIYDIDGTFIPSKVSMAITGSDAASSASGHGSASHGSSSFGALGGGIGLSPLVSETTDSSIPEFWRLGFRVSSSDKVPHTINAAQFNVIDTGIPLILNNITVS